jgi:hypothetical protein
MTSGTYNFRNFTINPGSLVSVTGTLPLVINCTGTAAIGGIFDLAGKNGYYNSNSCTATISYKAGGAGGEGGGGGGAPGGKGGDATINATTTTAGVAGTSFGSFSGGGKGGGKPGFGLVGGGGGGGGGGSYGDILGTNGGAGTDGSYAQAGGAGGLKGSSYGNAALTTVYNSSVLLGGSGGGGGGAVSGNPGRSSGAGGGGGGGAVGIYANDINLTNGLISVKGGNGGSGSVSANCKVSTDDFPAGGGGGGGSGGTVLLKYGESCISCNLGTNINISGGTGGTGVTWENEKGGNGGNGGNGRFLAQKAGSMPGRLTLSVNHTNFCAGDFQDITLSASGAGGATVNWYTGGCSGKLIGTGSQLSLTAPSSAITYYAAPAAATCNCTGIKVTVNKKPYVTSAPVTLTKNKGDSISFTVFSGGTPPFSYRWQHGSNIIPAASANSFRIKSVSCIDVGQYSCIISNTCGSITYLAATLSVNGCSGVKVSGTVRYNNKALKPMSASTNTSVFLKTTEDVTINTTATDENGNYSFSNILAGTYKLVCTTQLKWGGSSPLDALVINKSYIGTYTFTDALKLQAADVDLNSDITPADALAINKRFINLITLFKAPDWLFEVPVITVGSSDIIRDIKAICAGDADGSYNW